jgi:hypothetical protein
MIVSAVLAACSGLIVADAATCGCTWAAQAEPDTAGVSSCGLSLSLSHAVHSLRVVISNLLLNSPAVGYHHHATLQAIARLLVRAA